MRTGIYGEIIGAPQEALIFYVENLWKVGSLYPQHVANVREIIQEYKYYDPIMTEVFKVISENLFKDFVNTYSLEKRKHSFTDDTVLSIAVMDAILKCGTVPDPNDPDKSHRTYFREAFISWGNKYPDVGYVKFFRAFLENPDRAQLSSIGNGAAMRTAPIGYLANTASYLLIARLGAIISHNHPEAIRGALAVTDAVAQCRRPGATKQSVKEYLERYYFYDLSRTLDSIRPNYTFTAKAVDSVPEAIIAFLESENNINAVENALSLGGDTNTQAMIAGCIADAFYGYDAIPQLVHDHIEKCLPVEMMSILEKFEKRFILN